MKWMLYWLVIYFLYDRIIDIITVYIYFFSPGSQLIPVSYKALRLTKSFLFLLAKSSPCV